MRRFCYLRVTVWGCGAQQTAAPEVVAAAVVGAVALEVAVVGAVALDAAVGVFFITSASARTV